MKKPGIEAIWPPKGSRVSANKPNACKVWGLTGGIASGKSAVARFFSELGIPVIDADRIARALGDEGGRAHPEIVRRFGTADRKRLREIIFSDPAAKRDLEGILHPMIREESERKIAEAAAKGAGAVLYEAALLIETGRYREFDGLIVVGAPLEIRRARLIARDSSSPELADRILNAQAGDDERRKVATIWIDNSGSLEDLRAQVIFHLPRLTVSSG